ncbi:MAG TPA: sigma-54-dependent Fis family transcriptional regulator [Treponema sp.]|nr:MAG: sigma-54-dependent Fis family transcriptional regulator [Treponema sp. GWC1_61_84]OHE68878.1 MAG: sigma-54-dependent Fis family transcriptional regulator [Treponema sp. RIFOXYC1_FULL_61_9]HCM25921.1 sigma-54-dependent Fis family transcriptional regulator [Treponema sp.]
MASHSDDLGHREYIARSHERCRNYGIELDRVYSTRILRGPELTERLESKRDLIVATEPFVNQLYGFVKGSGFFAILTDEEGCILKVIGDEDILSRAFDIKMIPGAYMDERSIGTNAMGTALTENMPVQVSGTEHFIESYHRWTCSGAPIRDADGKVIGALDLTGNCANVHSHTLGMVVAAVDAIEKILRIERYNEELSLSKQYTETIIDSLSAGILTTDLDGTIKTVSKQAAEMFGYEIPEMRRMKAWQLFEGWEKIKEAFRAKHPFQEEDVAVNAQRNKIRYSLSAYPIFDPQGETKDVILVFKELRRVRKLANKIMGRQAIYTFEKIIGRDKSFLRAVEFAKKTADSRSTVLILGESGTGKELFAQAMHNQSDRKEEAFIAINCGALPRTLIESELFGYDEGAFTGAKRSGQPGKFEIADGGTLFLDEIGEMPLDLQTRLLRVIEEGTVCRIGGTHDIPVSVRLIAATNKDLHEEVESGNFRKDLYYRLNVLPLVLPPLRERKSDLPVLIDYFMDRVSRRLNKKPIRLPLPYLRTLMDYEWPGNVRELENLVELIINAEALVAFPTRKGKETQRTIIEMTSYRGGEIVREAEILSLEEMERRHIGRVLSINKGNMSVAARILGIGRTTLYRKIEALDIDCSDMGQCSESEQHLAATAVPF